MQAETPRGSGGRSVPEDYRKLLAAVLERALAETAPDLDAGDDRALVEIARRHRGVPLDRGSVLADLVRAILAEQFASLGPATIWQGCAETIARSLLDDPNVRARAERLWARLQEVAR